MIRSTCALVTILFLCCAPAGLALGQIRTGVGFHGGAEFSNLKSDPEGPLTTARTGLTIGGVLEIGIGGPFSLQLEPTYTQKGGDLGSVYVPGSQVTLTTSMTIHYVQLPLLLKLSTVSGEVRPFILTGPGLGLRLSAELERQAHSLDATNSTETGEFSWEFGGGMALNVSPETSLTFEARYALGLSDIDPSLEISRMTRDVRVLVGVMFTP